MAKQIKHLSAPKPTRWTLFWRTFLPYQFCRFVIINFRMMRMMAVEHKKGKS